MNSLWISTLSFLFFSKSALSFPSIVVGGEKWATVRPTSVISSSLSSLKKLPSKRRAFASTLNYRADTEHSEIAVGGSISVKNVALRKKPIINNLKSLSDFQSFLDEGDERLVAVKFHAPWCQSCRRLGNHYQKLASDIGDGILQRKKVEGKVRFAEVEFSFRAGKEMSVSETITTDFVTNTLQVKSIPTLHLYYGHHKVWETSGKTTTKELKQAIDEIERLTSSNTGYSLDTLAIDRDDGILKQAIEDSFYEYPSFLDEEW